MGNISLPLNWQGQLYQLSIRCWLLNRFCLDSRAFFAQCELPHLGDGTFGKKINDRDFVL